MELSNYQAFMECMRKWEKIGCNILCGLALWEQMQDCDRRGVPYTDIDIEAVSQEVAYRLMMSHDRLYALALYEWTEQHFAQNSDTSDAVGTRIDKFLSENLRDFSRSYLQTLIQDGSVTVNGKKVNIPSYQLKAGDVIEVREKSKQLAIVLEAVQSQTRDFPSYLEVDAGKLTAKYTFVPKFDDVPYAAQMEPNLVIEFYSR